METVTLHAPDISCHHCVMAIKRAVGALPGVSSVEGDPATKKVTVTYDAGQTDLARVEEALAEAGYPVAR